MQMVDTQPRIQHHYRQHNFHYSYEKSHSYIHNVVPIEHNLMVYYMADIIARKCFRMDLPFENIILQHILRYSMYSYLQEFVYFIIAIATEA